MPSVGQVDEPVMSEYRQEFNWEILSSTPNLDTVHLSLAMDDANVIHSCNQHHRSVVEEIGLEQVLA